MKHRFQEKVVRPRATTKSRSMRGVSRKEGAQERFEAALNNIALEHQALFRRHWMKFQGSRKRTGKEPHEAFYDWLNEHPETLVELEEKLLPSDAEIAAEERQARKRDKKSLAAPSVSPAKAAAAAKALARWQMQQHRGELKDGKTKDNADCRIDLGTIQNDLSAKKAQSKNVVEDDFTCENEFLTLTPRAARSACRIQTKITRLSNQRALIELQAKREEKAFECRQKQRKRQIGKLDYEIKVFENVLEADRKVKKRHAPKQLFDIPF